MFCIFRYLCVTVYIQLFSFRAASACLINSVVSCQTRVSIYQVYFANHVRSISQSERGVCAVQGLNGTWVGVKLSHVTPRCAAVLRAQKLFTQRLERHLRHVPLTRRNRRQSPPNRESETPVSAQLSLWKADRSDFYQ